MSAPVFVCIGYGEVGRTFAEALVESGADVRSYDTRFSPFGEGAALAPLDDDNRITTGSLDTVLQGADLILSMVTTSVAGQVAADCAGYLSKGQTFIDMNSTHPDVKRALQPVIEPTGAVLIEAAVLGLIAATGARTRTLLTGPGAEKTAEILNEHGLHCESYEGGIGSASTFKLLRSIFSKGVEAVLLETMLAARKAGLEEDVRAEIRGSFEQVPFHDMAESWMKSHAAACRRRRDEMVQVTEMLEGMNVVPVMTRATTALFDRSCDIELDQAFAEPPEDSDAVLSVIEDGI